MLVWWTWRDPSLNESQIHIVAVNEMLPRDGCYEIRMGVCTNKCLGNDCAEQRIQQMNTKGHIFRQQITSDCMPSNSYLMPFKCRKYTGGTSNLRYLLESAQKSQTWKALNWMKYMKKQWCQITWMSMRNSNGTNKNSTAICAIVYCPVHCTASVNVFLFIYILLLAITSF